MTVLLELQAAKDELARLEENAKRLAADIRQVADWVESATSPDFVQKMEIQQRHNKISSLARPKHYSQALSFRTAAEMVGLLIKARKRVNSLQQTLASLGTQ